MYSAQTHLKVVNRMASLIMISKTRASRFSSISSPSATVQHPAYSVSAACTGPSHHAHTGSSYSVCSSQTQLGLAMTCLKHVLPHHPHSNHISHSPTSPPQPRLSGLGQKGLVARWCLTPTIPFSRSRRHSHSFTPPPLPPLS